MKMLDADSRITEISQETEPDIITETLVTE